MPTVEAVELASARLTTIPFVEQHEVLHQFDHQGLLLGLAFGHQQRQRHQGVVVDQPLDWPRQQVLVQAQIPQNRNEPVRLLPSASGWFLITKYSRCAARLATLG